MVRVVAPNYLKPEHIAEAEPLFREMLTETHKEKGCIEYRLHTKEDEPGLFVFIEEWESMEDLRNHFQTEHFKRIIPQIGSFKAKDATAFVMQQEFK